MSHHAKTIMILITVFALIICLTSFEIDGDNTTDTTNSNGYVAEVEGTKYTTLEEAFSAAQGKTTVSLLDDANVLSTIAMQNKDITLELNEHTITFVNQETYFQIFNCKLNVVGPGTVKEGSPYFSPFMVFPTSNPEAENYSVLTIGEGVESIGWAGVFINPNGENSYGHGVVIDIYGKLTSASDGSSYGYGMYLNGIITSTESDGTVPQITIHDTAVLDGVKGLGIYAAGYGNWTIEGGEIKGQVGIEIRAGSMSIKGGTISGSGTFTDLQSNGSGTTSSAGAALVIAQHTTALPIQVNIDGGTFEAEYAVYQGNPQNNLDAKPVSVEISNGTFNTTATDDRSPVVNSENIKRINITGGTFENSSQLSLDIIDPAYSIVDNTVSPDPTKYVASVNGRYFTTLQAAFDYIESTDTPTGDYIVSFETDISESVTITQKEGKNVTVEGNERTMSGEITLNGEHANTRSETLTIQNVNFESTINPCIDANEVSYVHNLTITGCEFTLTDSNVAMYLRQCFNVEINDCNVTGGHSMAQMYAVDRVKISNVTIDSQKGIALGTSTDVTISNVQITAEDYGIRGDFSTNNSEVSITDSDITAEKPIVIRNIVNDSSNTYSLTVTGCTLITTGEFDAITLTTGDDGDPIVPPTGTNVKVTLDYELPNVARTSDGVIHKSFMDAIRYAQQNGLTGITLLTDVNLTSIGVIDISGLTVDLGGNTIEGGYMTPIFQGSGFTLTNGTVDGNGADYGLWIGDQGTTSNVVIDGITVIGGVNIFNATNVVLRNMDVTGLRYYAVWCDQGGQATIESGHYTSASSGTSALLGLTLTDSIMTINGGTFEAAAGKVLVRVGNYGVPVINGGSFNVDPSEYLGNESATFGDGQGGFSVNQGFVVTFMIGPTAYDIAVRDGEIVDTSSLPSDSIPTGFHYDWTDADGNSVDLATVNSTTTLYAALELDAPRIVSGPSVSGELPIGGSTVISITATPPNDGTNLSYAISRINADPPTEWSNNSTFTVTQAGTYVVWVLATCTYDDNTYSSVTYVNIDVTAEEPVLPPMWDDGDDYIPPNYVIQQTPKNDDTTKIIACAAAAVVAAILAAFIIMEYRKN